jgi:AcrR family transcriptional regulator
MTREALEGTGTAAGIARAVVNGRPASDLAEHPTARRMVAAAKTLLVRDGFPGLTLEAVSAEAGVNKSSTRYYFGGKRGLIEAVIKEVVLDECADSAAQVTPDATLEERVDAFIRNARHVAGHTESFGGFFEILPHACKDDEFRQRFVDYYRRWFEWNLEWLGLDIRDDIPEARRRGLGMLMAAVVDGLAVQATIFEPGYDATECLELFRDILLHVAGGDRAT